MATRVSQFLAILLALALPAVPALCQGSMAEDEPDVPACHARLQLEPEDSSPPDEEPECCSVCDSYVSSKVPSEAPASGALLWLHNVPEFVIPVDPVTSSLQAHPPPWCCFSPYSQSNSPLRI